MPIEINKKLAEKRANYKETVGTTLTETDAQELLTHVQKGE